MKASKFCVFVCAFALVNCSPKKKPVLVVSEAEVLKLVNTDHLLPKSYIINSEVGQYGDTLFYWDNAKFQLILVDKDFKWIANLLEQKGVGPREISFYKGHMLVDNKFIVYGDKSVVYNARSLEFLGQFELPSIDVDWIVKFGNKYVMGGLFYEENVYSVYSMDFSIEKGFYNQSRDLDVDFPKKLDELSKRTKALVMDDFLYILKPDIGELVKVSPKFDIIYDRPLPYSFTREENVIDYGEELDINIYEAWDFAGKDNKLYVLRSLDLANLHLPKEIVHRKTVHILGADAQMLGVFHLSEKAMFLSFVDNMLVTIDYNNEKYVQYKILD